ncbi:MAG: UpxY family transcription antiterminator [Bryobacteraceae bacterium]|nr:UpxY family transcription antiterminator [Bryobacteraceae bacterium]
MLKSEEIRWFALKVRSRHEKAVAAALRAKGYESFLPLYRTRHRWADRLKTVSLPLFPGYVFTHFDDRAALPVLSTPGVVEIVGFRSRPMPVEDHEIAGLRRLTETSLCYEPHPYVRIGERVRLLDGPLRGTAGILVAVKDPPRVVLSVEMLQRSVAVEIDRDWVMPAPACLHVNLHAAGYVASAK